MPSFDVVSKFNIQEIENSVNMVNRDIVNRFDFRGSNTKLTLNKKENNILIETNSEMRLNIVRDMLEKRAIQRAVSLKIFVFNDAVKASGMTIRQKVDLYQRISKDNCTFKRRENGSSSAICEYEEIISTIINDKNNRRF